MDDAKKKPDFDKIVRLTLLGMIALCMAALVVAVKTSGGAGTAGRPAMSAPASARAAGGQAQAGSSGAAGARAAPAGQSGGPGRSAAGGAAGSAAITVEAVTLAPDTIQTSIRLNGDVSSRSQISVYPDTAGKLTRYEVSVGSRVLKGDIIAYVDPSKPGASYVASPVRSPIEGTVIALTSDGGGTVTGSTAIATVGTLSSLEIVTYVPEKYLAVVRNGLKANVSLAPYPDRVFPAAVSQVSPVVDANSRTIQVKLSVNDGENALRPGMFAAITLVTQEASGAMVVPASALKTYNGRNIVYVIDEGGAARRKEVTVGLANDTSVQLVTGVAFGDRVVVSGSVTEGTSVRAAASSGAAE